MKESGVMYVSGEGQRNVSQGEEQHENSGEQELTDLGTKRRPKYQKYGERQRRLAPESGKEVINMRLYKQR